VVSEALEAARRGAGPTLIEALTYRLSDHTTADDASRYRSGQEVKDAWSLEPLLRLRKFLCAMDIWDAGKEQALLDECAAEVDAAVTAYLRRAKPGTDAMFDHLFAALPAHLHEQRLTARKYGTKPSGH
jgi:2-oxoisovalerate dehydrogenase E1 component alpha subunit